MSLRLLAISTCVVLGACSSAGLSDAAVGQDALSPADATTPDAGARDQGTEPDAAQADASEADAAEADAAEPDAAPADSGPADAGVRALYVDPQSGLDTNDGLRSTPLHTIAHAASQARSGEEIVLLPGVYSPSTEPSFASGVRRVRIPDGVTLRADQPGTVELNTGLSEGIGFLGRGRLADIRFNGSSRAITSTLGAIELSGLHFEDSNDSCGGGGNTAPISLGETATATLTVGSSTTGEVIGASIECLVRLSGDAHLTLRGLRFTRGAASIYSGSAMFAPRERSHLTLAQVTVESPIGTVLHATDDAHIAIIGSSFHNASASLLLVGERSALLLERSSIDGVAGDAVILRGEGTANDQHLVVRDSTIQNTGRAIASSLYNAPPLPTVVIERTEIRNVTQGVGLGAGDLSVTSSTISASSGYGIAVNNVQSLRVRATRISGCASWAIEATGFVGPAILDLGTGADPGGNDLSGNNQNMVSTSGLRYFCSAGMMGTAVGNTWEPNAQGTDADGHYLVPVGQNAVDATGPQNGRNYALNPGCVLRLAE
ncbi:MAG: right-handed parallel beta-helix repeat-containing protein [Myxococcota bacterium]